MNKIDGYSDFVQFVQNFLLKNNNTTAIVDSEVGHDVLQYFYEDSIFTVKDIADEDDEILSITKIGNRIIVEYPYNENGELVSLDSERFLVMEECIAEEEIEELKAKEVIIIYNSEDEEHECCNDGAEETNNEIIEDFVSELIEDLTDLGEDDCLGCLLKRHLEKAFYVGMDFGQQDLAESLKDLLNEIVDR